jgi:hypothetical protein
LIRTEREEDDFLRLVLKHVWFLKPMKHLESEDVDRVFDGKEEVSGLGFESFEMVAIVIEIQAQRNENAREK